MTTEQLKILWLLFVILVLVAFFLAVRRRQLAKKRAGQAEQNLINTQTTFVRPNGQEVRIHMTRTLNPPIQPPAASYNRDDPPPPAFDREEPAPPSYQDFNKDVLIQPSRSV